MNTPGYTTFLFFFANMAFLTLLYVALKKKSFFIIFVTFLEFKNKFLKSKDLRKKRNVFSSILFGFYKVKAFCIKYKIAIIIISSLFAAATIVYTLYTLHKLNALYIATHAIVEELAKAEIAGRVEQGENLLSGMSIDTTLDPMDQMEAANALRTSVVEDVSGLTPGLRDIGEYIREEEKLVKQGVQVYRCGKTIVILCFIICAATVTMTYIDLPDLTPLLT